MTIHRHSLSNVSSSAPSRAMSFETTHTTSSVTTRTHSATSMASFSSIATTPEFSPMMIQNELGDLLHVNDLELDDSNIIDDYDDDDDNGDAYSNTTELCEVNERLEQELSFNQTSQDKYFICLIGLPASGKSTVVRHLIEFITEHSKLRAKSFNAGDVRRKHELEQNTQRLDFDFTNQDSRLLREKYCFEALKNLTDSLVDDTIDIGILDATNSTAERRSGVFKKVKEVSTAKGIKINPLILEVKCKNMSMRRFNIDKKASNQDYRNYPKDFATVDFLKRVERYERAYVHVTFEEIQKLGARFFSMTNVGEVFLYDCGNVHAGTSKKHHRHCTKFKSLALSLIYEFLATYRSNQGHKYCVEVETFYKTGIYKPVNASRLSSSSSLASLGSLISPITSQKQHLSTVEITDENGCNAFANYTTASNPAGTSALASSTTSGDKNPSISVVPSDESTISMSTSSDTIYPVNSGF